MLGKIVASILAVLVVSLLIITMFFPYDVDEKTNVEKNSNGTDTGDEFKFLKIKPGTVVNVSGKITDISYLNTTYGSFPIISIEKNSFEEVGLLSNLSFFNETEHGLEILGDKNGEYEVGKKVNFSLIFEEFNIDGKKFLWAEKLGSYLKMPLAIDEAISATFHVAGFSLSQESHDSNWVSYKVYTRNNESFPLDIFNVTFMKLSIDKSLDINGYYENVNFSNVSKNLFDYLGSLWVHVTQLAPGSSYPDRQVHHYDFNESISENTDIDFVDTNSNNKIDTGDFFKVFIEPTNDKTILETYNLLISATVEWTNGRIYSCSPSCLKYIINWHNGVIEINDSDEIKVNFKHYNYTEDNNLIDTNIDISEIKSDNDYSYNDFFFTIEVDPEEVIKTSKYFDRFNLSEDLIDLDEDISFEYQDVNNNDFFDSGDKIGVYGIEKNSTVTLKCIYNKANSFVGLIEWKAGDGVITIMDQIIT